MMAGTINYQAGAGLIFFSPVAGLAGHSSAGSASSLLVRLRSPGAGLSALGRDSPLAAPELQKLRAARVGSRPSVATRVHAGDDRIASPPVPKSQGLSLSLFPRGVSLTRSFCRRAFLSISIPPPQWPVEGRWRQPAASTAALRSCGSSQLLRPPHL